MRFPQNLAFLLLSMTALSLPSTAFAGYDELNLTDDKSTDPQTSAVFVPQMFGGAFHFVVLDLLSITDLSVPLARQKVVKLTRLIGRWDAVRVSPGRFRLVIKCAQSSMGMNRVTWQEGEIVVDASPGRAYVVNCAPRSKEAPYPTPQIRETTPDQLPRR